METIEGGFPSVETFTGHSDQSLSETSNLEYGDAGHARRNDSLGLSHGSWGANIGAVGMYSLTSV